VIVVLRGGVGVGGSLCCNEHSGLTYLYSVAMCKGGERERFVKRKLLITVRIGVQRVGADGDNRESFGASLVGSWGTE